MKKESQKARVKKLQLHREVLRPLDPEKDGDFLKVAGGMPLSPATYCALTNGGC